MYYCCWRKTFVVHLLLRASAVVCAHNCRLFCWIKQLILAVRKVIQELWAIIFWLLIFGPFLKIIKSQKTPSWGKKKFKNMSKEHDKSNTKLNINICMAKLQNSNEIEKKKNYNDLRNLRWKSVFHENRIKTSNIQNQEQNQPALITLTYARNLHNQLNPRNLYFGFQIYILFFKCS